MYLINSYEIPRTFFFKYYFQYNRSSNFNSGLASFFSWSEKSMEIFPERKKGGPKKWKKQKKLQAVLGIYVSLYTYDLHILQLSQ